MWPWLARPAGGLGLEMPVTSQASPLSFSEVSERAAGVARVRHGRCASRAARTARTASPCLGYATTVFAALGCEGISRIDFLIDADDGALYFNEINTLRSLANISGLRHRVLDDPTC